MPLDAIVRVRVVVRTPIFVLVLGLMALISHMFIRMEAGE